MFATSCQTGLKRWKKVSDEGMAKNIRKSYIWTADKDVNESDPRSNVHYLGSSENKAWKNSGLYGIWTHDLCDTGAALYQLS